MAQSLTALTSRYKAHVTITSYTCSKADKVGNVDHTIYVVVPSSEDILSETKTSKSLVSHINRYDILLVVLTFLRSSF